MQLPKIKGEVRGAIFDGIWYIIRDTNQDFIRDAIWDAISEGIQNAFLDAIRDAFWDTIWVAIRNVNHDAFRDANQDASQDFMRGNFFLKQYIYSFDSKNINPPSPSHRDRWTVSVS